MTFNGRINCRTVSAKSQEAALRTGAENACADLTSGMTNIMRCQQSEPQNVRWIERPGSSAAENRR